MSVALNTFNTNISGSALPEDIKPSLLEAAKKLYRKVESNSGGIKKKVNLLVDALEVTSGEASAIKSQFRMLFRGAVREELQHLRLHILAADTDNDDRKQALLSLLQEWHGQLQSGTIADSCFRAQLDDKLEDNLNAHAQWLKQEVGNVRLSRQHLPLLIQKLLETD